MRYRVQGNESVQTVNVLGDATTNATISGLTPSTSYMIKIAAMNSAGIGVYSDPLTVETSVAGQSRHLQVILLLLLSHTCTPPGAFVRFLGMDLSNHSYVDLTAVGDAQGGGDSVQCHTDLVTCCNATAGPDVETGTSPMELNCQSQISCSISLRFVKLSKLICDTEEEVMSHLVYIAALLRPMQSIMMMVGRLCMQDCMPVEVRRT